jgi:transaldolase
MPASGKEASMPTLRELSDLGQAVWLDYIRRSFVVGGELQQWIDRGVRGVTANPTILEKAIDGSSDYDEHLARLAREGKSADQIYEALALEDIGSAADLLRPVYDQFGDGFVSLEVSPSLAHDTQGTIVSAQHLFAALSRPNVFIKVPATEEGFPAIEELIRQGINVNVTLIFSLAQYEASAEAYLRGLERRIEEGKSISHLASVASFFVSRVDTAVDKALEGIGNRDLQGRIAVANAKLAYARFKEICSGPRWEKLARKGGKVQRPLWASTGTKNPNYSDTLYVDELIGPHTVNTLPPATLEAFLDHGKVALTVGSELGRARSEIDLLAKLGIDLNQVTEQLTVDGVALFAKSFDTLMASIAEKSEKLRSSAQA